jgi:hypothetical protein
MDTTMHDANEFSIQMAELQRMRVALVIELLCAERDMALGAGNDRFQRALDVLQGQERAAKADLAETEGEIRRMEEILAKIDFDIGRLCQA